MKLFCPVRLVSKRSIVLSDIVEVPGIAFCLCFRLRVPMSSGDITVGGFFSCFVRFANTSAFRCFNRETTGLIGTFVPFSFIKFGTILRTKATLWYKYMKRICKTRFPMKTIIVSESESLIGLEGSSLSVKAGLNYFISVVIGFAIW